jgi:hypothetical protein
MADVREKRNAHEIFLGKPEVRDHDDIEMGLIK